MNWSLLASLVADSLGPLSALKVLSRLTGDKTLDDLTPDDSSSTPLPPPITLPPSAIPIEFFLALFDTQSTDSNSTRRKAYDSALEKYDAYLWTKRPREMLPESVASFAGGGYDDETTTSSFADVDATVLPPSRVAPEDAATHWGIRLPSLSLAESLCRLCRVKLIAVVSAADKRVVVCACGCAFHRPCLREANGDDDEESCPFC